MMSREKHQCQNCQSMVFVVVRYQTTIHTIFGNIEYDKIICEACQKFFRCYSKSYEKLQKQVHEHMLKEKQRIQESQNGVTIK